MNRLLVLVTIAFAAAPHVGAEELNLAATTPERPSLLVVRTGVDHALVAEVGYRHLLAWGDRQLFVGGDVTLPWAKPDLHDYQVRGTVGLPFGGEHWKLAGWLSPTVRGTANALGDMTALGADLRLTGGYYTRGWFVGGEVGLDWVGANHIAIGAAYRDRAFPGAKDGWYALPGGTAYAGVQGGLSFSSVDVVLRAGLPRTTSFAAETLPAYLTLGVNVALPR